MTKWEDCLKEVEFAPSFKIHQAHEKLVELDVFKRVPNASFPYNLSDHFVLHHMAWNKIAEFVEVVQTGNEHVDTNHIDNQFNRPGVIKEVMIKYLEKYAPEKYKSMSEEEIHFLFKMVHVMFEIIEECKMRDPDFLLGKK